jgi:hypothetical protein
MGLINLLGLGGDVSIPKALTYFERSRNDSRALNAIGYIYFKAPDYFSTDLAATSLYGPIRKDMKKAKLFFEKSAR